MKIFIVLIMCVIIIQAYTIDVSGNQSGTWSAENNPYNVIGDITVPEGEMLQILPGVEIVVQEDFRITVEGQIEAIGIEFEQISFRSVFGGISWSGIRLENETLENTFAYCEIKNAENGISSINSAVSIEHCTFLDNEKAINIYGIGNARPVIVQNCNIVGCQQNGIYIVENSNTQILNCNITQCALDESPRGAIMLSSQGGDCSPLIRENYIHHNVWQGITAWDITGGGNIDAEISLNDIAYNLSGIYLYYAGGIVDSNSIHHNSVAGNPNSGAGIMIGGESSAPIITNNDLSNNFTGFYFTENAAPNLGDITNDFPGDDGNNHIHDNMDESGNVWSIYNISNQDIMAENNIWDSIDPTEIAETIFDGNDNPACGIVDFEPIFPPTQIDEVTIDENISLSCFPNPFIKSSPKQHLFIEIHYSLPKPAEIEINIYNLKGQKVDNLVRKYKAQGSHTTCWYGTDSSDKRVSSGVYFYRLDAGEKTLVGKMMLID